METLSTMIILAPVLLPMVTGLGIDPIHFGVIMVITNEVAMLTPPLGVNLFVASRIANLSVEKSSLAVLPYLLVLTISILIVIYCPFLSTWLPAAIGAGQ